MTRILTITDSWGAKLTTRTETAELTEVDGMNFSYGALTKVPGTPIGLGRGVVPPGAEVPMHASPDAYAMYIVAGHGVLLLQTSEGDEITEEPVAPGMVLTFSPGARHGWRVDSGAALEWFGVEIPIG